jgi:hypothetical protein
VKFIGTTLAHLRENLNPRISTHAPPQWADAPTDIRQWFQSLMQRDNSTISCCCEADAFEAYTIEVDGDHSN